MRICGPVSSPVTHQPTVNRTMNTKSFILTACLIPAAAFATGTPAPEPVSTSQATAQSAALAAAQAGAIAGASATGGAGGAGGDAAASATGGAATSTQQQTATGIGGSATASQGNQQTLAYTERRQAPSVGQGGISVPACGAGGNAGGSNTGGAAFLGLAFTPRDCKLLLAASAYQALGMYDAACEMVNGVSVVRARWRELGVSAPSCEVKPPEPVAVAAPSVVVNATITPDVVTHAELAESQRRQDAVRVGK